MFKKLTRIVGVFLVLTAVMAGAYAYEQCFKPNRIS